MSHLRPLICLALMHTLVDTCALLVAPIWPELEISHAIVGTAALSVLFIVQSMPTSISQGFFGYFRDRRPNLYLIWLGPLVAAVCLTLVGVAPGKAVLCLLLIVGGIGVGAFHPEAAVVAGRLIPDNRTRGLSIFMLGGSLGLALGPTLSGGVVNVWGLPGLLYLAPPILFLIPLLVWSGGLTHVSEPTESSTTKSSLAEMLQGREKLAIAVLFICSFRLVPNMAMDKVVSFVMDQHHHDRLRTGLVQSMFLISASVGMFLMATLFRSGWERRFMILCPLAGIPLLIVMGWEGCPTWLFVSLLVPTGLVLWGTTPAMVSYGQQAFPKGRGLASAITMGLSWGLGGLIQAPITAHYRTTGMPQQALLVFVPFLALAACGAWFLPAAANSPCNTKLEDGSPQQPDGLLEPLDA